MMRNTTLSTIARIILQELRTDHNISQVMASSHLGLSSGSSWSKVESGDTPLSLEHILTICSMCHVLPSVFFNTVQNYVILLSQNNWFVEVGGKGIAKEDDDLGKLAKQFYSQRGTQRFTDPFQNSTLLTPWLSDGRYSSLLVFDYAINHR